MKNHPRLVGVIHLPPLPGAPGSPRAALQALLKAKKAALTELGIFVRSGFDGVIVENFGDAPFYGESVPPETVASMAIVAQALRLAAPKTQLGINVLRNDASAALAIAAATGLDFIRVNVLSGVAATDQGWIEGRAAAVLREKRRLGAERVRIYADAHVKHAVTYSSRSIGQAARDLVSRAGADGVIVSGAGTGSAVDLSELEEARAALEAQRGRAAPLYVGSGVDLSNLSQIREHADGVIVSSSLRRGGRAGAALDPRAVRRFGQKFKSSF